MLQHTNTFNKNKKEIENKNKKIINTNIIFREQDFADKEYIFILAKTWGAAKQFFDTTVLRKFRNRKVEYISNINQITEKMNKHNTVVIKLSSAFDTYENVKIFNYYAGKGIKTIDFKISTTATPTN